MIPELNSLNEGEFGLDSLFKIQSIWSDIPAFLKTATILAGVVALVYLIASGFQYITSGGNEEGTKKAKKGIGYAVAGLVIVFLSYAIINAVLTILGEDHKVGGGDDITNSPDDPEVTITIDCPESLENEIHFYINPTGGDVRCIFESDKLADGTQEEEDCSSPFSLDEEFDPADPNDIIQITYTRRSKTETAYCPE